MTTATRAVPVNRPPRAFGIVLILAATAVVGLVLGSVVQQTVADRAASVSYWPDEPLAQHTPAILVRAGWPDEPLNHHTPRFFGSEAAMDWPDLGLRIATATKTTDTFRLTGPSQIDNSIDASVLATEAYGTLRVQRMLEQAAAAESAGQDQGENEPIQLRRYPN